MVIQTSESGSEVLLKPSGTLPPETNVCGQLSLVKGRGQSLDGLPGCGSTRKSGIKEGDNWQPFPELPRVPLIEIHPLITATSEQTAQSHVV